jgi:hypothetical protein
MTAKFGDLYREAEQDQQQQYQKRQEYLRKKELSEFNKKISDFSQKLRAEFKRVAQKGNPLELFREPDCIVYSGYLTLDEKPSLPKIEFGKIQKEVITGLPAFQRLEKFCRKQDVRLNLSFRATTSYGKGAATIYVDPKNKFRENDFSK